MFYYELCIINSPLDALVYSSPKELSVGSIVFVKLKNRSVDAVVLQKSKKPKFKTNIILDADGSYFSKKQMEVARFISSYYVCSLGDAFGVMLPFRVDFDASGSLVGNALEAEFFSPNLSDKQKEALEFLKQNKISLLFGDTGSGKTEIYISYFSDLIKSGKRCIFLMPEISLTPQMGKRLEKYFAQSVVMWHSKLTPLQKRKALQKIYDGSAKIIAGPRSALFLPLKDLALIVVDEEHDESYKSSSRPRYNARDIAVYMGKIYDINVVLGSATPSLNSYVKFPSYRLKGGFFDSVKEFIYEKSSDMLSQNIYLSLEESLKKKEQSIIFVPTRANFKYLSCKECGEVVKCVYCNISMSVHNSINALKCHYCNYVQAIPGTCYKCGSSSLGSSRIGTAEVVKEIEKKFQDAKVELFDRDSITTSSKLKKILKRFNDADIDILVGTQMLSKGHDYHGVTLAVILGIDNMLNMGDFRAREKALSMFMQVSGRSGRLKDAKVIVQSFNEEFFETYRNSYEKFLENEKAFRIGLYPPYKKLCRVLFSHKNLKKAQQQMQQMYDDLSNCENIELVGYGKCPIDKIANKYRFEILIRADKSTDILKALKLSMVELAEVDMDPLEFS